MSGFSEGRAEIEKDGKYGYIDENLNIVIEPQYGSGSDFSSGLCAVKKKEGLYSYIDKWGNVVIPPSVALGLEFTGEIAPFSNEENAPGNPFALYGFINKKGVITIPPRYIVAIPTEDGYYQVSSKLTQRGLVDSTGREIIPPIYDLPIGIGHNNTLFSVSKKNKFGFVDGNGNVVIPLNYSYASPFAEDYAYVISSKNRYGYIDRTGKIVIPFKYEGAKDFQDGIAGVKMKGKWAIIGKDGQLRSKFIFDDIGKNIPGLGLAVKSQGKWGFIKIVPK